MIEVFSDFQCPGCKQLHEQTVRPLSRDYVRSGKVYLIHREFPLPGHAYARDAASYACAAGRIGKYEQASDALFRKQAEWAASGKVDEVVCAALTAAEARKVRALAKDPAVAAEIARDMQVATAAGIRQTPTLVVTHRLRRYPISGNVNYAFLCRLLDGFLAK